MAPREVVNRECAGAGRASDEVPRAHAKGARWVAPVLVGEVAFSEWTRDGRMRHPTWRGLREDKSPDEVVRET